MERKPIVEIKNVKKIIGVKKIIDNISFEIYPGEIFGFLGPNGAGKTTTIRMMVGLMEITEGEILINGFSIKKNFEQAISYVGGIVENPEMYKFLSGYKNLVHYARMVKGVGKERIDQVVKLVGLESRIHDKVRTYSLGMRQRLGLAQALLHSPSILILDEPVNGLDPAGIREFRDYLKKLAKEENIAVMISSHILAEIELICDRIGIIQQGKLVGVQSVNEFVNDSESTVVQFIIDSAAKAKKYLAKEIIDQTYPDSGNEIHLKLKREEIPEITSLLVQNGVKIYGIKTISKSLEEKFLEVTGGKQIG